MRKLKEIYIAGPFFNPRQVSAIQKMEMVAADFCETVFSPRKDGGVLVPNAPIEERRDIFDQNVRAIDRVDLVVACIDDFDPGTIWEMGYAFGKTRPVATYSDVEGRGLNVMLAQSCEFFANGPAELQAKLQDWVTRGHVEYWRGEVQ